MTISRRDLTFVENISMRQKTKMIQYCKLAKIASDNNQFKPCFSNESQILLSQSVIKLSLHSVLLFFSIEGNL